MPPIPPPLQPTADSPNRVLPNFWSAQSAAETVDKIFHTHEFKSLNTQRFWSKRFPCTPRRFTFSRDLTAVAVSLQAF